MNLMFFFIILFELVFLELLYFKIADRYNIVDQPNHRSSHTQITIRGGGIIFSLALFLYPIYYGLEYKYFLLGLALISIISFIDDIRSVSNRLRILFHLLGVALMFYQLDLLQLPFYWIILALLFAIGSINALNFMDGINGITGGYALITLCSLLYINIYVIGFIASSFLITSIISLLVFNYFNFRKKARCFAGDVGSISIAFIIVYFLLQLIIKTGNFSYLLLLLTYGLDSVSTIIFRCIRKENIFEAHRSHFYQYLTNEKGISHLTVAGGYMLVQLIVNVILLFFIPYSILLLCLSLLVSAVIFVGVRFFTEGSIRLLGQ